MPNRKIYLYFILPFTILLSLGAFLYAGVTNPYFPLGIILGALIATSLMVWKLRAWRKRLSKEKLSRAREWYSIAGSAAFLSIILFGGFFRNFIGANPHLETIIYSAFGVIFIAVGLLVWAEARYKRGVFQE